jgi:hypothetical protein
MKTSNIILSTLIGSITLLIVTGAMQLRITGALKSPGAEQVYADTDLAPFKYLVIRKALNLSISPSDKAKITIYNAAGQGNPNVRYHQEGDTLFIDEIAFNTGDRTLFVVVTTPPQNVVSIRGKNSTFALKDFPAEMLRVELDESKLSVGGQNGLRVGTLKISGINNSEVYISEVRLDTLDLSLDHSEGNISGAITKLKGSMINHASLTARDVNDIEFKKDSTSILR